MRKIVGAALATCGLIVVLTAIALATVWKPSGIVTAQVDPGAELVRTAPGVLELVDTTVTITATDSADANITLAFGTAVDTGLWAEGLSSATVTGMSDWETLSVDKADPVVAPAPSETPAPTETATAVETPVAEEPPAEEVPGEEAPAPAETATAVETPVAEEEAPAADTSSTLADMLAVSDMWTKVEQGTGSVELTYTVDAPGITSIIAASSDGSAPTITLSWQGKADTSMVLPLALLGVVLAAAGALLIISQIQRDKTEAANREVRQQKLARRASRAAAETSVLTKFDGDITDTSRHVQMAATGRALGAGIIVGSPRAEELRGRDLPDEARMVITPPETEQAEPSQGNETESASENVTAADNSAESAVVHNEAGDRVELNLSDEVSSWRKRWGLDNNATNQEGDADA